MADIEINLNVSDAIPNVTSSLPPAASAPTIAGLSLLFFAVGAVGIAGNLLVIFAILGDPRMRGSPTNLLITNLALSDLVNMVSCVPDIVQFIGNRGWRLGLPLCAVLRFAENLALYASVMTLVSVCIERYVAIMHPIKAHIMCCRSRILVIMCVIWPAAMVCASPNLLFHEIRALDADFTPCLMRFPSLRDEIFFKYAEFLLFYLVPLLIQIVLYIRIGRHLFSTETLTVIEPAVSQEKFACAMKARKGVIKMLVAGVSVYFISMSPHQVLLIYNTFSPTLFKATWSFLIFSNIMAYTSSACNPLLYSIFSQKFRQKFQTLLSCCKKGPFTPSPSAVYIGCRNKTNLLSKSVKTTVTDI